MTNLSQPIDRLARGYAREELRKLTAIVGVFGTKESSYHRAHDVIEAMVDPYFRNHKRLPETVTRKIRAELKSFITNNFSPIGVGSYKARIHGFEGRVSEVNAYYYLQPCENVILKADGSQYSEKGVEIRSLRLIVDRRRVVLDDFSCNITFTDHTLMRLVERGACSSRPLDYIARHIVEILFYVPLFTIATLSVSKRTGVMIPTPDGVLMGDFTIATDKDSVDYAFRRRLIFDASGGGVQSMKNVDAIQGYKSDKSQFISIRMSTFLELDSLGADKRWCWENMWKLHTDHEDLYPYMIGFLTSPEVLADHDTAMLAKPIFDKFSKNILYDARWGRACKINLLDEDVS